MTAIVSNLKKISMAIRAAAGPGGIPTASEQRLSFIFGVAGSGLCPFEIQLADKAVGEKLELSVLRDEIKEYFGHLSAPLVQSLNLQIMPSRLFLEITITGIEEPVQQEIVKAMAAALSGDCDCGCDCH
ncbi:hypothetical protein [Desulfopila inferna]|uniref:hypothetical protein n=1 Tax=Desulfopila inferna TaxID=468528 RepID=UPI001963FF13|nr:hypothetical protein [Desulfopila inferna]MBM9606124.1 hypothetical protein [Desulfopila inferna]